jgi:nucleoside-diphosphate-sugar epimerase
MGKTVAITGGTGFIGRRLVRRHLELGDSVRVLSRDLGNSEALKAATVTTYTGDLATGAIPRGFVDNADVIYHCAAELRDSARMAAANVAGTQHLIEAVKGRIGRWVQLSSAGVYGLVREGVVDEDSAVAPGNLYEETKASADRLVASGSVDGGYGFSILRPSNVFGPNMTNRALYRIASMIRRRLFFYIGPPGASANYIYADNVVDALLLCGSQAAAAGQVFNLNDYCTLEELVDVLAASLNVASPARRLPRAPVELLARISGWIPGNPLTVARVAALTSRARYPISKISNQLGYRHRVTLAAGLTETIDEAVLRQLDEK